MFDSWCRHYLSLTLEQHVRQASNRGLIYGEFSFVEVNLSIPVQGYLPGLEHDIACLTQIDLGAASVRPVLAQSGSVRDRNYSLQDLADYVLGKLSVSDVGNLWGSVVLQ